MLSMRDLSRVYRTDTIETTALDNIDLDIEEGEAERLIPVLRQGPGHVDPLHHLQTQPLGGDNVTRGYFDRAALNDPATEILACAERLVGARRARRAGRVHRVARRVLVVLLAVLRVQCELRQPERNAGLDFESSSSRAGAGSSTSRSRGASRDRNCASDGAHSTRSSK